MAMLQCGDAIVSRLSLAAVPCCEQREELLFDRRYEQNADVWEQERLQVGHVGKVRGENVRQLFRTLEHLNEDDGRVGNPGEEVHHRDAEQLHGQFHRTTLKDSLRRCARFRKHLPIVDADRR